LELNLPLQNSGTGGGSFGLRDMASVLEADGERGMRERITGRESRERQGRPDSLVEFAGVSQGADKAVMRLNVRRIGGNGGAKCLCRFCGRSGCEQFETLLGQRFGVWNFYSAHGYLQNKSLNRIAFTAQNIANLSCDFSTHPSAVH
jgi:hypothetical protein